MTYWPIPYLQTEQVIFAISVKSAGRHFKHQAQKMLDSLTTTIQTSPDFNPTPINMLTILLPYNIVNRDRNFIPSQSAQVPDHTSKCDTPREQGLTKTTKRGVKRRGWRKVLVTLQLYK